MKKITLISLSILSFLCFSCEAQVKQNDIPIKDAVKNYTLQTVASDIAIPWGMTWLPDGALLITEKSGVLYHIKNGTKTEIKN